MIKKQLLVCILLSVAVAGAVAADNEVNATAWVNISDPVVTALTNSGTAIPWPGGTGGVAVDRTSGTLYIDICNLGLWKSTDHGQTFQRFGQGQISGRCVSGSAINCDPAGLRMACLLLDGKCGMTLDGGQSWQPFAGMGRNWEYGVVDWSDPQAKAIFADRHESGGEKYVSSDAGASWKFIGKHPEFASMGIFDARILVAGRKDGILRSTDGGETWTKISDLHPMGQAAVYFNGLTYWLAKEGIITSGDKGATWQKTGVAVDAGWGPFFGKDAQHIVVANARDFWQTSDGGRSWRRIAPMPHFKAKWAATFPGEYLCVGWDPNANILYASRLADPVFRLQLPAPE
jgi:photosystem II stability/assembly factor-like uncharacterized protein